MEQVGGILQDPSVSIAVQQLAAVSGAQVENSLNTIAECFTSSPAMCTGTAASCFIGMSVDAFLNHDFRYALMFYKLSRLAQACTSGAEQFFQRMLMPIYVGDTPPGATTPWATNVIYLPGPPPPNLKAAMMEYTAPLVKVFDDIKSSQRNEFYLLRAIQKCVSCCCLDVEDPDSESFGRVLKQYKIDGLEEISPELENARHAYTRDCNLCNKPPVDGTDHKKCARCKLVRYCSVVCQKADWKQHKEFCRKSSEMPRWWGCTPRNRDPTTGRVDRSLR